MPLIYILAYKTFELHILIVTFYAGLLDISLEHLQFFPFSALFLRILNHPYSNRNCILPFLEFGFFKIIFNSRQLFPPLCCYTYSTVGSMAYGQKYYRFDRNKWTEHVVRCWDVERCNLLYMYLNLIQMTGCPKYYRH